MKQINKLALVNQGLEANNEAVETTVVDAVDVGELRVDYVGSMGDEGFDLVGVECNFEEVNRSWVCVLVHFVVKNIHSHGGENEKGILGFGFRSVRVKIQSGGRVYRRKGAKRDDCK